MSSLLLETLNGVPEHERSLSTFSHHVCGTVESVAFGPGLHCSAAVLCDASYQDIARQSWNPANFSVGARRGPPARLDQFQQREQAQILQRPSRYDLAFGFWLAITISYRTAAKNLIQGCKSTHGLHISFRLEDTHG